ncbi:MAG: hypothetical protein H6627_05960 [Calditrichae bacterium]|nr:hypothetical protein [Calditrichia bacterium]
MTRRICVLMFLFPVVLLAQSETIKIDRIGFNQIHMAGFTLTSNAEVNVKGVGAGGEKEQNKIHNYQEDPFNLYAYAWILDAHTREMVWRMTIGNSSTDWWNKTNREFDENVKLPAGEYELYFSSVEPAFSTGFMTLGRWLEKMLGSNDWEDYARKWNVTVSPVNSSVSDAAVLKYQRAMKDGAIVNLNAVGDRSYLSRGFTLSKSIPVEIYAVGEGWKGEMFDYGWLIDANTRQKVWQMRYDKTDHAGGAIKNRVERETINLAAGDYLLYFKTDDNHSHEKWNANPPYDPEFWGVAIFPKDKNFDESILSDYRDEKEKALLSLIRVGDNEYKESGLSVEKSGKFRIYALGEGRDGEMYDYGWITDVETGKTVWKMDYRKTEHAGGANKNRLFNDLVYLDKGKYIVHYKTDGSHSYNDWNSSAPYEPDKWGISIYQAGKDVVAKEINSSNLKAENVIAQLTRVGNDEHLRRRFTLDKTTQIRVYAIGEGDWDEMYDYGWIENEETGRKVWQMRYRSTEHAGGAKKNRLVDTIITLDRGTYTVHYVSDDSHSYNDWNQSAPYKEIDWGITLYRIN